MTTQAPGVHPLLRLQPLRLCPDLYGADVNRVLNIYALYRFCMDAITVGGEGGQRLEQTPQSARAFSFLTQAFREVATQRLSDTATPGVVACYDTAHLALLDIARSPLPLSSPAKALLLEFYTSSMGLFETLCTLYKEAKAMLAQDGRNLIALHQRDITADALNRLAGLGKGEISIRATAVLSGADSVVVAIAPAPAPLPATTPAVPAAPGPVPQAA